MKKRLFAMLLAACLMLSLIPAPAFAAEETTPAQNVQALIDALPNADTITAENKETVAAQLTAIDEAKLALSDEERDTLDVTRYNAAIAALNVLDNMAGAEVPQMLYTLEYITAVGNGDENWLNGEVWVVDSESNKMTEVKPGVWEITYNDVAAFGNYQVKFTCNGAWQPYNWTIDGVLDGGDNRSLEVSEDGSSVTLRIDVNGFDFATGTGSVKTEFIVTAPGAAPSVGHTITFDPNYDTATSTTDTTDASGKLTALPTPTREGYAFSGWYTAKEDGDEVTVDKVYSGNTTLYAHWNPNGYTVRFDANGGTGEMENQSFAYNDKKALFDNAFTYSGKKFLGWNTQADGTGTSYANKATVEGLTAEDGDIVILYAQWGDNTYTVKFHANGGTGTMVDQTLTCGKSQNLSANGFTAPAGYKFQGWRTSADGTGTLYGDKEAVKDLSGTDGDTIDLYAQWTANTYTVRFNANGGKGTMKDLTLTYDKSQSLTANAFTFAGHKFRCWNTKADGTGTPYTDKESVKNLTETDGDVITLYAQWDMLVQKVEMKLSGHAYESRVDSVKVTTTSNGVSFPGATYDGSWGITTSKTTLTTRSGELFDANQQYYLWVKFQAKDGYLIDNLKAENVLLNGTAALSLTKADGEQKPTTLTAVFRLPVIYTIETSAGNNGSISPEDTVVVFEGEDVTIKITPDKDYVVYRLKVDGQTVKTARTYTFENIQKSYTIRATFLKNGSNAKTGDSFPLIPAIAVLALSAVALTAIFVIAKKKKNP